MLIPKDILSVHRIASKDETRPSLMNVHAERDERHVPRLVATDGVRLIAVAWVEPLMEEEPPDFGDLTVVPGFAADVPAAMCVEVARVVPRGETGGEVYRCAWLEEVRNGTVTMGAGVKSIGQTGRFEAKDPEGEFPKWREIASAVKPVVRIGVNAKLLAELLTVLSTATGETGVVVGLPEDPLAPISLTAVSPDGRVQGEAVIMPMQLDLTGKPDKENAPVLVHVPIVEKPKKKTEKADGEEGQTQNAKSDVVLQVDFDKACPKCGRGGATGGGKGLCLRCCAEKLKEK